MDFWHTSVFQKEIKTPTKATAKVRTTKHQYDLTFI